MTEYNHLTDPLRNKRITASMVGAILGNNPWMTRDDAMRSMVRDAFGAERDFSGNIATEHGNANERNAILDFQFETGIEVEPSKFIAKEGWAGCSPDGLTSDGGGIETKCPYSLKDKPAPVPFKSLWMQKHYLDQVQFSLWVTDKPHWYFAQWTPSDFTYCKVEPDIEWQNDSIPRLKQFYAGFLDALKEPDEYLAPKRVEIDTPEAHKAIQEWDDISEQLERLTERKKDLLAAIAAMGKGKNMLLAGRKVTLVEKAGSISYAKAIKTLMPDADLEKWRGKASSFWRVS